MPIRLCLIGYGAIATHHARILQAAGAVLDTVVGRVPEDAARFAAEFGIPNYTTDLDSALAEREIDAVVVASPNSLHHDQTKKSLLAGKHVLSEIPLSTSYSDAAELVEVAERQRRTLMVAHSQRFVPALVSIRKQVEDGSLHLYHVTARFCIFRRSNYGWTGRQRSWTDSLLWHHGGHYVDAAMWLLGASDVDVQSNTAPDDSRTGTPLDLDVLLRTPSGQLANVSLSYNAQIRASEYYIVCEEDTFHYAGSVMRNSRGVVSDLSGSSDGDSTPSWEAQDREFLTALSEGRRPSVTGADVLPAMAALQKVEDQVS